MLRAILIDDEPECLRSLAHDLGQHCPGIEIVAQCDNGKEAIKEIHTHHPDVLFLDIDMPYINGFDLLEMVPNAEFEVIFTTAYDKYAIQAFRISAVDYLLKPIDIDALKAAVEKVRILREKGNSSRQIGFLIQQLKDLENNNVRKVALPTFDGLEFIHMARTVMSILPTAASYTSQRRCATWKMHCAIFISFACTILTLSISITSRNTPRPTADCLS